jgi:hypothetical protein
VRTVHHVYGAASLPAGGLDSGTPEPSEQGKPHIVEILHQADFPDTALILSDGSVAHCLSDAASQSPLSGAAHTEWLLPPGGGACCGAISARAQKLAIGCSDGVIRLWSLGAHRSDSCQELSLADWGHSVESTGAVQCIVWSTDSEVCPDRWLRGEGVGGHNAVRQSVPKPTPMHACSVPFRTV